MRIITNHKLIKRNARIGQIAGVLGLLVLIGGLYFSFQRPEQGGYWLVFLVVGFALSQLGIYFGNRYVRPPRPDQALNTALKGMDKRYTLLHYKTPASHLLIGPPGIWALFPRYQRGTITYEKGRWRQKGGGAWLAYLKLFGQEGLGRPDLEMGAEIDALKKHLTKNLPTGTEIPPINAVLAFTHPEADIQTAEAPIPTMQIKEIKPFIRKIAKESRLPMETAQLYINVFVGDEENNVEAEG